MSFTRDFSRRSVNTSLWTQTTFGSTRITASTSAFWAIPRLLFQWSGTTQRSRALLFAPAYRTIMALALLRSCPASRLVSFSLIYQGLVLPPGDRAAVVSSVSITTRNSTRQHIYNISSESWGLGWDSTGAMTVAW